MHNRLLIVTHHAPDLDAIGAVWLLKQFDSQKYADAKVAFVNPGDKITLEEAEKYGCQLHQVTHVDTGLGEFDHHQLEQNSPQTSASSLVFDYLCQHHPDLKEDTTLQELVKYIIEVDNFLEIHWPEPDANRYVFMLPALLHGHEFTDPHNDESQLHFGMQCLNNAYAALKQHLKAKEILREKGQEFSIKQGKCLGVKTRNDDTIKLAQKRGFVLVVRKDSEGGHIRIKVRPDVELNLKPLHKRILEKDQQGTWYYHPSGKMLLNGSRKHRHQKASKLSLEDVISLIKEVYE